MAGSITGNVVNQRTSQPIADASLKLSGSGDQSVSSGPDGRFALINLAEGNYDLLVTKDGFEDGAYGPLIVLDDLPLDINLALQPKIG